MNINGFLQFFLDSIEEEKISIIYDELDVDDDVLTVYLEDLPYAAIDISITLDSMDIYCAFPYNDYSKYDRARGIDEESLENEVFTYWKQKEFERFLKQSGFKVDVWDDGCYLCHGFNARVGFNHVDCKVEIIKKFVEIASQFFGTSESGFSNTLYEALDTKLNSILQYIGFCEKKLPFDLKIRDDVDYSFVPENSMLFFFGDEYVLFKKSSICGAILKEHYNLFMDILEEIELFDDTYFEVYGSYLRVTSCALFADIPQHDVSVAINYERMYLDNRLTNITPFLSEESLIELSQKIASADVTDLTNIKKGQLPHIYTEGITDWRHIKHAFQILHFDKSKDLVIEEYSPDADMGDQRLLEKCKIDAQQNNHHMEIMIFDRDNAKLVEKVEETQKGFKDWGNRVYSFALPVPQHRQNTPNICIEHYYTDSEITTEIGIDGIKRRLYLGYEFDKYGRSPMLGKLCRTINKCGSNSIAIIDDEVYELSSTSDTNYALSKVKFTDLICNSMISHEAKEAFKNLFSRIDIIMNYDRRNYKSKK